MHQSKTKCVFGPIPSRRLGLSLGIDLLPFKTCSMDCVYCECGATTRHTLERKEYFPTESVIKELDEVLSARHDIDYVTFSGVGEPTLHGGIGRIISHIKKNYPNLKICLLTNASLFSDEKLAEELEGLDLVVPSLDGSNDEEFTKINRPAKGLELSHVVDGIIAFRKRSKAQMWLEVFIIPGVNDSKESAERFRDLAARIKPDKVQLNSLDRPGVEPWVIPASDETLDAIAAVISQAVPVEKIARHAKKAATKEADTKVHVTEYNDRILTTLRSRPCTAEDIAVTLNLGIDHIKTHLRRMERAGLVKSEQGTRGMFYRPVSEANPKGE